MAMKYNEILDELVRRNLATNRVDFARKWLGADASYCYKLDDRRQGQLPLDAMWRLAVRLEQAGQDDLAKRVWKTGDELAAA